ncbi:fdxN element excision controlling factor protein (plasmid) [Leptolyngbya boryana NIES-2135]|jgi:uncharacterized membrane protein YfbV (UPF0208 family)|uniref:FdxN element excision controlling factor protein n=1 Tax=Leptolyngbya boryana NIES-2135 TaxID=1973484 RepID=A0A1Z4JT01_LEPBY|nr:MULTISPECIES: XisI protein [Leptolyngbya]BAY59869.1 fdxN element excision controlling factor protein [Leptolyngbya boryana NIES-2135]MBD2369579.1 XisI protein [Leptolyngbya sp. FACHB-161]MBD2375976.1 XisI protein [Leptolyngbya sp. FACHB-238]MBD2400252.1 XisI protein [Leptolyngbya sp. FACHB-239]MBD2406794.1 XisI protein [Leptolyngbya sp. FACHB-402]
MDRVEQYRNIVKQVLQRYYDLYQRMQDAETALLCDPAADQYQVIQTGWDAQQRRIYTTLHLSLKNGKIYIHSDPTEEGIANVLIEEGIPKADIILEYQAPTLRKYSGFAQA